MPTFSLTYSLPYLIFFLYLIILMFFEFRNINNEKDTKYIQWATIAGFIFFFGLRGYIFTDWLVYNPLFEKIPTFWEGGQIGSLNIDIAENFGTDVSIGKNGIEFGFIYFTMLFKSIIPNYFAWVFFNTIIDILLLNIFIKRYSKYYVLGFICFFVFEGIGIEANLMRNVKAILLFLVSIKYLEERRILPYMSLNFVGFLFHTSAIIFFPLYFFLHKEWPQKIIWGIFIAGIIIFLLQITYLAPVLNFIGNKIGGRISVLIHLYLNSDLYSRSFGLFHFGYLERVFTFCIIMSFQKQLKEQSTHNIIFLNAYVIYFIIYFFFSEIRVVIERVPMLFVFGNWVLYPNLLALIKTNINKTLFLVVFILFSSAKLIKSNSNVLAKYDNLLFGIDNYEIRDERVINNGNEIQGNQ